VIGGVSTSDRLTGHQGGLLNYDLQVASDSSNLFVTVQGVSLDERSKVLSEAFYGSLGMLVDSFDFVSSVALNGAGQSLRGAVGFGPDANFGVYGSARYGKVRHETGSHVDVSGVSGIIGLNGQVRRDGYELTLGVFAEAGNGDYDTYNSFPISGELNGAGDINYGGAGILARLDALKSDRGSFHAEVAGRFGSVKNTFKSVTINNHPTDFESKGDYFGVHVGTGYVFNFDNDYLLDVYAKYFWTRQAGDTVGLPGGDVVSFDDVNSHRVRAGASFTFNGSERVKPYVGAAYEHEMDGKVSARSYGLSLAEPDPGGASFVGEAGVLFTPTENISLNLAAQGYAGKRRGVTGSLGVQFLF
jgi:outer membrane autotransporter protein